MSTEIAVRDNIRMQDLSPAYAEIMVLAKVLQMSGYFRDVQDQAQAVTKILFGRELGFSPIISMSGIFIIEGKPALSANLLAATIKRSGKYDYRIVAWDSTQCEIMFREKRDGKWEDIGPSRFDMEDAKRAGVANKGTWAKYPKAMLFARALSQGERAYCPDVSACALYVPEELGATVNESGEVLTTQDLPRSARPVEVTQEDIPLDISTTSSSTRMVSAATSEPRNVGVVGLPRVDGQIGGTPVATGTAEAVGSVGAIPPSTAPVAGEPKPSVTTAEYPGCIDKGRTVAFGRAWDTAIGKDLKAQSQKLRYEWLARHGYVDADGSPTSAKIPLKDFEGVKRDAIAFAAGLRQQLPVATEPVAEDRIW